MSNNNNTATNDQTDLQNLEVVFYGDKIQGKEKQGTLVLSENLQIPDSLLGVLVNSPAFKAYFKSEDVRAKLNQALSQTKNLNILFPIHLNNAVQNIQLCDEVKRIYLKKLTKQIEQMSSVYEFENSEKYLKLALKFVSHGLHLLRVLVGDEDVEKDQLPEEQLEITADDETQFEVFNKVIELYDEAQGFLQEISPNDILQFMQARCGRYDSYYTVQEFISFLLRCFYNMGNNLQLSLNMMLNVYLGLPVYNIRKKLRKDLLVWVTNRNWPEEDELVDNDEKLKQVGITLSKWSRKIVEVIKLLDENEFDVRHLEEKTKFYDQIKESSYQYLAWTYAPLTVTPSGGVDTDFSFLEIAKECYLTTQSFEIKIIDGINLYSFEQVQISSMEEQQKCSSYKALRKSLCKKFKILGNEFVVASPRNPRQASYCFEDEIIDTQFMGDRLHFYRVEGAKKELRDAENPKQLLFIKMSEKFLLPVLVDPTAPLSTIKDNIQAGLQSHQFEVGPDSLKNLLKHGSDDIDWNRTLNDYASSGSKGVTFEDENSRIAVLFSFAESMSPPAYKREAFDEPQRFKVQINELLKAFFIKSEETSDFDVKYVSSKMLAVNVTHHSLKIDTTSSFVLNAGDFSDGEEAQELEVRYQPFAVLAKSYSGFELIFRRLDGSGDFYGSNSGNIYSLENISDRKAAIIYYLRDDVPEVHGMEEL